MTLLTGRTANLPKDAVINAGVIMRGTPPVVVGTTIGGFKFDPGKEIRHLPADGTVAEVVGGHRIVKWMPVLSWVMQELGDSTTGKQFALLENGGAETDTGHQSTSKGLIRTLTPKSAGVLFSSGDYLTDVIAVGELAGGGSYNYARFHFPYAYCRKYDLQTADSGEAKIAVELLAVLSASDSISTPGKCPYTLELSYNLPS
jgi:hypothetical protein